MTDEELIKQLESLGRGLRQDIGKQIDEIRKDMAKQRDDLRDELTETTRDVQTKLLDAFYGYARTNDVKMKRMSADISNSDQESKLRLEILEQRVLELERRVRVVPEKPPANE